MPYARELCVVDGCRALAKKYSKTGHCIEHEKIKCTFHGCTNTLKPFGNNKAAHYCREHRKVLYRRDAMSKRHQCD